MERDTPQKNHHEVESFDAFDRALAAAVTAHDQLAAAVWSRDHVRVELAARAAVASWLQASADLRRLEPNGRTGPRWRIGAFVLAANHRAIAESFDRTRRMVSDARLLEVLDQLTQMVAPRAGEASQPIVAILL